MYYFGSDKKQILLRYLDQAAYIHGGRSFIRKTSGDSQWIGQPHLHYWDHKHTWDDANRPLMYIERLNQWSFSSNLGFSTTGYTRVSTWLRIRAIGVRTILRIGGRNIFHDQVFTAKGIRGLVWTSPLGFLILWGFFAWASYKYMAGAVLPCLALAILLLFYFFIACMEANE